MAGPSSHYRGRVLPSSAGPAKTDTSPRAPKILFFPLKSGSQASRILSIRLALDGGA